MNLMNTLELLAKDDAPAGVSGRWCALRMSLDRATGEQVNVGVLFQPDGNRMPVWRLLRSVGGLRCLYGPDGAASASFAIDQAGALLARDGRLPDGWTISAGKPLHAHGATDIEVVDTLFARVVPLARHEKPDAERLDGDDHQLSTAALRSRVRDIVRKRYKLKTAPPFWRDTPVSTRTVDGHQLSLDLQVWVESGLAVGAMAAITSTWYTSKFHRDSYLNNSYRALTEARQAIGVAKAKAGLFVLRPMIDGRFTKEQLDTIDDEIDAAGWQLKRRGIDMHTFDNETALAEGVLELA